MESPYSQLLSELEKLIDASLKQNGFKAQSEGTIELSKAFGDVSCSVAFRLTKELKKSPNDIAKSIVAKIKNPDSVSKITVDNGFINFHLERGAFAEGVVKYSIRLDAKKPVSSIGKKSKVIIEYPSVNPNKPWHIGHLRNALLGDAIANAHQACGFTVEREDYIDDLGLQIAESLWGYLNLGGKPSGKFDLWLGEEYVKVNKKMKEDEAQMKKALADLLALMEQDGTYESKMARELSEQCVIANYATSFNYGIYHDVLIWESDIVSNKLLSKALQILERSKVIKKIDEGEYKGCTVIDLEAIENLPKELQGLQESVKVLIRSNGAPTYVAKDIAFHMWKFGMIENTFKFSRFYDQQPNGQPLFTTSKQGEPMDFGGVNKAINIIDVKQSFPQAILRLAFSATGKQEIADGIKHLPYGRVDVEGGGLSGRAGTWEGYTADILLEEARSKALSLIGGRFKLSEKEQHEIANAVALAAIRFEFLRVSPETFIMFSWQKALNFEGSSGPYCQYMYARAMRLINDSKIDIENEEKLDYSVITSDTEFKLLKLLSKSKEMVEKTCNELRPNVLTEYIIDLASAFSTFYEEFPVLKAKSEDEKKARLALTLAFARSVGYLLALLGIGAIERM